jgi:hypothetical protein
MIAIAQNLKVIETIVRLVVVPMMHYLCRGKPSSEGLLNYFAMLKDSAFRPVLVADSVGNVTLERKRR